MWKKAKALKNPEDAEHAYNYALFLLNLSNRTEGETRDKMQRRGYIPEVIEGVILRLRDEDKYIDDERYTENYIESMKRYKYYGPFMMKKRLLDKKLDKSLIAAMLEKLVTNEDELDIATRYVEKNFGPLSKVRKLSYDEKQKIMRRLMSRGFGLDIAKSVVN